MELANKTAFVTGGGSGIGLAITRAFISCGMNVIIADINTDALEVLKNEFDDANVLLLKLDVRDRDAYQIAVIKAVEKFGNIHVLCNNAGVGMGGSILETSYADWDWSMSINVDGVINGVRTLVDHMVGHGEGGHIVNTASLAGVLPVNNQVAYNTSKYAVMGLSESMRKDLAPHNIGVTVLCPGFVATNIFASKRPSLASDEIDVETLNESIPSGLSSSDQEKRSGLISKALDPAVVGLMVVRAIARNSMYLFTHPEFAPFVESRANRLAKGFQESEVILSESIAENLKNSRFNKK